MEKILFWSRFKISALLVAGTLESNPANKVIHLLTDGESKIKAEGVEAYRVHDGNPAPWQFLAKRSRDEG